MFHDPLGLQEVNQCICNLILQCFHVKVVVSKSSKGGKIPNVFFCRISYTTSKAHALYCIFICLTLSNYFISNWATFSKKLNWGSASWFFYKVCWKICYFKKKWQLILLTANMPFYRLSDMLIRLQTKVIFEENSNIKFNDISPSEIRVVAVRKTDMTEQNSNFIILGTRLKFYYVF